MQSFFITIGLFLYTAGNNSQTSIDRFDAINVPKTFVEQLRDGESVTIVFSESGCFTDKTKYTVLKIKKEGTYYFASYTNMAKKLSAEEVNLVKNFELKLDSISTIYKCTVNQHYLIRYKKKTKNRIDNTCSWHGFGNLVNRLFKI